MVSNVRISVANSWEEIEKTRAVAILKGIDYLTYNPESSHFCTQFTKSKFSPDNFEEIQEEFKKGCIWRKSASDFIKNVKKEELPDVSFNDFPKVTFDYSQLNETVGWLKQQLNEYGIQRNTWKEIRKLTVKKEWENTFSYLAPFFLCFALALRITKVSGEVKHE